MTLHASWLKLDKRIREPFVFDDGVIICEKCEFIKGEYCRCEVDS